MNSTKMQAFFVMLLANQLVIMRRLSVMGGTDESLQFQIAETQEALERITQSFQNDGEIKEYFLGR